MMFRERRGRGGGRKLTFLCCLPTELSVFVGKSRQMFLAAVCHCKVSRVEGITTAAVYQRITIPTFYCETSRQERTKNLHYLKSEREKMTTKNRESMKKCDKI